MTVFGESSVLTCGSVTCVVSLLSSVVSGIFFFQAEDGIRDLVRSRGLGDVYKRQPSSTPPIVRAVSNRGRRSRRCLPSGPRRRRAAAAVSYTHLTLPTSDLV